jgi:hypothetical protein
MKSIDYREKDPQRRDNMARQNQTTIISRQSEISVNLERQDAHYCSS